MSMFSNTMFVLFPVGPDSVTLTPVDALDIVADGRRLRLQCSSLVANPAPDLTWTNGTTEIPSTGNPPSDSAGSDSGKIRTRNLELHPTRYEDGDVYSCTGTNPNLSGVTPAKQSVTLNLRCKSIQMAWHCYPWQSLSFFQYFTS
jgi:hypothetical protein